MDPLAYLGQFILGTSIVITTVSDIFGRHFLLQLMAKKGIPCRRPLMFAAIALKLIAGVAIAVDYYASPAAYLLASFCIVANVIFHDFWRYKGAEFMKEYMAFMTHVAIIGGLIIIAGS